MKLFEIRFSGIVPVLAKDEEETWQQFDSWCPEHLVLDDECEIKELTKDSTLSYDIFPVQRPKTVQEIIIDIGNK